MTDYQTIITAAGDSRPLFLASGFGTPKSLVLREGRTVLEHAVNSYADSFHRSVVAINREEADEWPIESVLLSAFPGIGVIPIPTSVKGALISALMAAGRLDPEMPLVVAAGDSFIRGGIGEYIDALHARGASAGTIVFRSNDPRWSYLATNSAGYVTQVAEKRIIGTLATTGVFYFRRGGDFLGSAQWCLVNSAHRSGIYYVSSVLNRMLMLDKSVYFAEITKDAYVPCALPADFVGEPNV